MFENLNKKQKIIFIAIFFFMLFIITLYIYTTLFNSTYNELETNEFDSTFVLNTNNSNNNETTIEEDDFILVHVSGYVKKAGLVKLESGSRINDAIEAAGGLSNNADLTNINLAYILEDGEKIYIPKKGEEIANSLINISTTSSKININKATQSELETLPGVGPSTALKIINYREKNGKFSKIEDIKNISGVGDAKYENMKDYISVK